MSGLDWLDESTPAFWRVCKMKHNELHALLVGLRRARDSWRKRAKAAYDAGYQQALEDARQQLAWSDSMGEATERLDDMYRRLP